MSFQQSIDRPKVKSDGNLTTSAKVTTPGPHYVGQAIEIAVQPGETSEILPPKLSEADASIDTLPSKSGPRFLVIPRHPGTLVVGPFRVRLGDRTSATRPIRLTVEKLPTEGRSLAFLGGVGSFDLKAEVEPSKIRLGQSVIYRIRLTGSAAWGSDRPPDLAIAPGLRVESLPIAWEPTDPPTRTFAYRLRPGRAGRWVLPPLSIAALDPKTRRYLTRVAPGLAIEVEDAPRFQPNQLVYGSEPKSGRRWMGWLIGLGLAIGIGSGLVSAWLWRRGARASKTVDPARLVKELLDGLGLSEDSVETARQVSGALESYLQKVGDRSGGALTPPEAEVSVARLSLDRNLAGRAGALIDRCDRARFGFKGREEADGLIAEVRSILISLGTRGERPAEESGPREAVETPRL